jgi:hypothetical protein
LFYGTFLILGTVLDPFWDLFWTVHFIKIWHFIAFFVCGFAKNTIAESNFSSNASPDVNIFYCMGDVAIGWRWLTSGRT